jgi:CRP/FNR family transcriptional regulator, cyclic AMP receptor protein
MAKDVSTFNSRGFDKHVAQTTTVHYAKGQPIYSQDAAADAIFRVEDGSVKLSVALDGKRAVIAVLCAGECFGEGCLEGDARRTSSATAVLKSEIVRVPKAPMLRRLRQEPALARLFISYLLLRVASSEGEHANHLLNSSERRLARALLRLTDSHNGSGRPPRVISLDQRTLAEMVGTTRSRVSFFMNRFRKKGFIAYNGTLHVHRALLNFLLRTSPKARPQAAR